MPPIVGLAPTLPSFSPEIYHRIVELLISARKNAGLTQADVGRRIGQRQTFVSKIETSERRLDAAEFIEIAKAVGADPCAIMRQAEKPKL